MTRQKVLSVVLKEMGKYKDMELHKILLYILFFSWGVIMWISPAAGGPLIIRHPSYIAALTALFSFSLLIFLGSLSNKYKNLFFRQIRALWRFWVLFAFILVSALYTNSPFGANERLGMFCIYVVPLLVVAFMFSHKNDIILFRDAVFILSIAFLFLYFMRVGNPFLVISGHSPRDYLTIGSGGQITLLEGNPIRSACFFFIGAISGISIAISTKALKKRVFLLGIVILMVMAALSSGSLGPTVSFLFCLLCFVIFATRVKMLQKLVLLASLSVILSIAFVGLSKKESVLIKRSLVRTMSIKGEEDWRRGAYLFVLKSPPTLLGHGLASFWKNYRDSDSSSYVHNTLLEMYFEGGIVGLTLYLWMVFSLLKSLYKSLKIEYDPAIFFCLFGFLFFFVESFFSGTFLSSDWFLCFYFLGTWSLVSVSKRVYSEVAKC